MFLRTCCFDAFPLSLFSASRGQTLQIKKECVPQSQRPSWPWSSRKPWTPLSFVPHLQLVEGIAKENGFNVAKGLCGHGVGKNFHMQPSVLLWKCRMIKSIIDILRKKRINYALR